jgi:hypothetical protein
LITLMNQKNSLKLKQASAGEGFAQYFFLRPPAPGQQNRWEAKTSLVGGSPARWSSTQLGSGGESVQITLGERSRLFACSGFVRGDLQGTIRAPALRLKMMGKEVWAFFLHFETDGSRSYRVRCEKESLAVAHGSTSATATINAVDGSPPKILASLTSDGTDYKRVALVLDRAIGKGSLQDSIQEDLAVLTGGGDGYKDASWAPVNRDGLEVLWIFSSSGFPSQRGQLKDLLEALGAHVSRSLFAGFRDYAGGREMDDFVIADDPAMSYQLGLSLDPGKTGAEINDWASLELLDTDAKTSL